MADRSPTGNLPLGLHVPMCRDAPVLVLFRRKHYLFFVALSAPPRLDAVGPALRPSALPALGAPRPAPALPSARVRGPLPFVNYAARQDGSACHSAGFSLGSDDPAPVTPHNAPLPSYKAPRVMALLDGAAAAWGKTTFSAIQATLQYEGNPL
jgi:hypothetical protein